jgi:hypothetical protein
MSFNVPNFNLRVNIWRNGNAPPAAADLQLPCNLAFGRRVAATEGFFVGVNAPVVSLLLPPSSDIRGPQCAAPDTCVECPAGTGRIYAIGGVDDSGKGWPNEFRVALLSWTVAFGAWPSPIP